MNGSEQPVVVGSARPRSRSDSDTRRRLAVLPMALAAVALLALGLPRAVSVFVSASGEPVLRQLQDRQPVSEDALRALIAAQEGARSWITDGRVRTDLGLAWLLLSEKLAGNDPAASADALQRAIDALRSGLALAPANPYAWSRLAYAEALSQGWAPPAVAALRLALITAPYEPRLLWSRLQMTFLAWSKLASEDRELVFQQIRWAWQANPAELARLALETKQTNLVRAALLRTPADGLAFEQLVKQPH